MKLYSTASIEENSHIYSMDIPDGGPIPTSFSFDTVAAYRLAGKTYEVTKPVEVIDEAFGFKIKTFSTKAEFRQKIIAVELLLLLREQLILWHAIMQPVLLQKMLNLLLEIKDQTDNKAITTVNTVRLTHLCRFQTEDY